MRVEREFATLAELRTEIDLLKIRKFQQEELLKDNITNKSALIYTYKKNFQKKAPSSNSSALQGILNNDIVSNIAKFVFPLVLNGTMFKKSGFITRTIVTFLSTKAAGKVNTPAVTGVVNKVKGWFDQIKGIRTPQKINLHKTHPQTPVVPPVVPPGSVSY